MKLVALFALCSLLFHGGICPQADADGAIPIALKRSEIVFVDTGVAHHNQLLADLQARHHTSRHFKVHVLDGRQSGIEQITKVLAGYRDVDAIHVLSHGMNGAVQLGNTWLYMDHLDVHARAVASWREALSRDADLLFYGCNVAGSQQGRTFIQAVSALTGADVAASSDTTGHARLGGNWLLEYATGSIETNIAPDPQLQAHWVSVLDLLTFQEGFNAYTSMQDTELDSSSPGTIRGTNSEIELDNSPQRVGLIRFDNIFGSGPNQIPFGSIINSATLTVRVSDASLPGANITLHRMLVDWDETSTWTSMGGGIQLDDVEASFMPDSILPNPDQLGSQTFSGLNATLQAWSNSSPNYGWVIVWMIGNDDEDDEDDEDNEQLWRFYSSDELTAAFRPILTVDYTPAIVVTNTNNAGAGSLRQAILDANALGGTDTITFNIPLTDLNHYYYRDDGIADSLSVIATTVLDDASISDFDPDYPGLPRSWYTIELNSALPDIDDPVVLDATTQPGYVDAPIIELDGSGISSNDSGLSITADDSTVRGLVINRFNGHGIVLAVGDNNVIEGSYIGSDVSGTIGLGNGEQGIQISNTSSHTIGGTTPGAGNVISGNNWSGVSIQFGGSIDNVIQGNTIGTDPSGTIPVPNALGGIVVEQGATDNTIGGTVAGSGNVIAFNSGDGIRLEDASTDANVIQGNSIFSNAGLGIDLDSDGVTPNDDGDGDTGPNSRQNFPVLTSANTDGTANLYLGGVINGRILRTFRVEFFANSAADPSGHGEGEIYLGFTTVMTGLLGNGEFNIILPAIVPVGSFITATATDQTTNETSEFSAHVPALDMHQLVVDTTDNTADAPDLTSITALLSNRGGDNLISLREAILATNATSNGATPDEIRFNIPDIDPNHFYYRDDGLVGLLLIIFVTLLDDLLIADFDPDYPGPGYSWFTIQPVVPLPAITDPVILDGTTQPGFSGKPIIELDGTLTLGSDGLVVGFGGGGTTIRGLVINRFDKAGIWIHDADGNKIEGNYIGTDVTGTLDHGNVQDGISIENSDGNTIGGSTMATRNVISGNNQHGVIMFSGSTGNVVSGDFIGVDVTGTVKRGNSADGINIRTSGNTIGGIVPGSGNIISGNNNDGINIDGSSATGNVVHGNVIGSDLSGVMTTLGNSNNGITIQSGASNNTIGGTTAAEANIIAFNQVGVAITQNGSDFNQIRGNSIYSNTGLGIDLNDDGLTLNDLGDSDGNENDFLNYPVITSAATNEVDTITISGTLNSIIATNFDLDFFYTDTEGSEGQVYLGSIPVSTNGSGIANFNNISFVPFAVPDAAYITATATVTSGPETGNTSEFSADVQAVIANQPPTASIPALSYPVFENTPSDLHLIGMSVSDPDAGMNDVLATLSVGEGILTVNEGSAGIMVGGSGTRSVTLNGMLAEINDVLSGNLGAIIVYTALDDPSLSTNLTLTVDDLGHSGSGGPMSDNDTTTLNITAENDDPSNTGSLPTDVVVTEDVATQVNLAAIDLSDVDAGTANLSVTLVTSNGGTLSALDSGGVAVGSSGTGTLTLDGTVAALNAFLDDPTNIQYVSAPNAGGDNADSLTIDVTDNGNMGSGGGGIIPLGSVNVDITPVGDTPQAASIVTLEDTQSGAIVLDRNANDETEVTHFRVSNILNGMLYQNDGVTVIDSGDFILVAQGQAGLKFTPSPNSTVQGRFDVESSEDGLTVAAQSGVVAATITVIPVGDTPQAASVMTFEDTQSGAIVLDRNINDGAEVTHFRISNIVGGTLYYSNGLTIVNDGDFITFAQGYSGLRFTPSLDSNAVGSFDVESSDGLTVASQSSIATATINISPVNDGPSATIALASYAAAEDTPLTLHGTGLSVDDPDAGASTVRVTLSVGEGSLTVTAGSTGASVSGSGSASVTFEGTLTQINDWLAGHLGATITYNAAAATDTVLTLHIDDLGASGSGGLLTATDTATLTIAATTASNSGPMAIRVSHNAIDENTDTRSGYRIGMLTATDPDIADTFAYTIVGGADAAKFSIGGAAANELILTDGTLDHETISSYGVTVRVIDSGGLAHDETFVITVTDLATVITAGQSFSVSETDASGAVVGTVGTTGDDPLTFAITGGNVNNAFAIDASGTITVADSSVLDFDTTSSYTLTVEVSDGTTAVSETVTITVTDVAATPSSGDSGPISSPPAAGEETLIPNVPPGVNPEVETPESVSEDGSSISNPTPAEDGSPEPQTPNPQVSNPLTPNPQAPSPPASAPRPTRLGTDNNGFVPGRNSAPSRNSERVETPAPISATSAKRIDAETIPIAIPPATDDLRPLIVADGLFRELDGIRDEIREDVAFNQMAIGSTLTFVTALSIGYVLWLVRGGLLLSSLLSSLPAWRFVDPLPVLAHLDASAKEDETEDDSLEAVLQKGADVANAQPESTSRMNVDKGVNQSQGPHHT